MDVLPVIASFDMSFEATLGSRRWPPHDYFTSTGVIGHLNAALNECYAAQPKNPLRFISGHLNHSFDVGVVSAVRCVPRVDDAASACGLQIEIPSGEVSEVAFKGLTAPPHPNPVRETVNGSLAKITDRSQRDEYCSAVGKRLSAALAGCPLSDQGDADRRIQQEDGTANYADLGSVVSAAASFAVLIASSKAMNQPPFVALLTHTGGSSKACPPLPLVSLFGCGDPKHFGKTRLTEVCVYPSSTMHSTFRDASLMLARVSEEAKRRIGEDCPLTADGSLKFTQYDSLNAAVDLAEEIIRDAGFAPGNDCQIGLVIDSAWCCKEGPRYAIADTMPDLSGAQLSELFASLCREKKSVCYLEDTHHSGDANEMRRLMSRVGASVSLCGVNSLGGSRAAAIEAAAQMTMNTFGSKLEDCGSISALIHLVKSVTRPGTARALITGQVFYGNSALADVAVGIGARFVRIGGLHRGGGTGTLNRLMDIDEWLLSHGMRSNIAADCHASCELPPPPAEAVQDVAMTKDAKKKK